MTASENRKPIIILVVIGVLVVGAYAVGVGLGTRDRTGDGGWQSRLSGLVSPGVLTIADLSLRSGTGSGSCSASGDVITFAGACAYDVPAGGSFSLGSATRRARLTVGAEPVRVSVVVEGKQIDNDMNPADTTRLTFGSGGGSMTLVCRAVGQRCTITIDQERSP